MSIINNKLISNTIIGLLILATALYHLYLGFLPGWESLTVIFTLDFFGYIILFVAFFLPRLKDYREYTRIGLVILVIINILGYIAQNIDFLIYNEGVITKSIEVLLLISLLVDKYLIKAES